MYGIRNLVKKYTTGDNRKELLEIFYVNAQNPLAKKSEKQQEEEEVSLS